VAGDPRCTIAATAAAIAIITPGGFGSGLTSISVDPHDQQAGPSLPAPSTSHAGQ
jgi:hypothetical protein